MWLQQPVDDWLLAVAWSWWLHVSADRWTSEFPLILAIFLVCIWNPVCSSTEPGALFTMDLWSDESAASANCSDGEQHLAVIDVQWNFTWESLIHFWQDWLKQDSTWQGWPGKTRPLLASFNPAGAWILPSSAFWGSQKEFVRTNNTPPNRNCAAKPAAMQLSSLAGSLRAWTWEHRTARRQRCDATSIPRQCRSLRINATTKSMMMAGELKCGYKIWVMHDDGWD